jgi:hypothetical protein
MVVVETNDVSGPHQFRTIGPLQTNVELPHVHFDAYGRIGVVPTHDGNLPSFVARLSRGSSYRLPDVLHSHTPGIQHVMERTGVLTSGAENSRI